MTTDPTFWNALADRYSKQAVALPEAFERKIEITRAHLGPDSKALDIGCGTGSLVLRLADAAAEVHGLDFSGEMIRIAREKTEQASVANVAFHVGRAEAAFEAFETDSLDVVCGYSLLHLVEDHTALMRQVYNLLKPGGAFVSSTPCLGDSWVPYRPILAAMRMIGKAPPVFIHKRSQLKSELESIGFVDIETPDVGAKKETAFIVCRKPH